MTYKTYISSSGIKIYLINSNKVDTVNITIHVPIGASSETEEEYGIAHYLEHMLFTKTKKYTEDKINNLIDFYGADINAETHYDKTLYYINGISDYVLEFFDILYEIYFNNIITIENFEHEKSIIIEELKKETFIHGYKSDKLALQIMFNDRYNKFVGGDIDDIKKINIEKLNNFKNKHYTPNNTNIIFFGKFNNNKVIEEIITKIGPINEYTETFNNMTQELIAFKNNEKTIIKYIKSNNEQIIINFYFRTINKNNIWNYKIMMIINILTNSLSSLIRKKLRTDKGLIYGINSSLDTYKKCGYFNISFNCHKKNINYCTKEVLKILCKLKKNYINELFITKSINKFKTTLLNLSNNPKFELNNIIKSLTYNIIPLSVDEIFDIIKDTNVQEINQICKTLFHPDNTIIIIEGKVD
jgi:predicted Zn-dependent peptidase